MRFTTAFVACGLAVAASAQSTTATEAPSSTVSISPEQSSVIACLDDCEADDLVCLARCNPVPNPNKEQVKATHDCVTKCDQGDGSAADTKAYGECVAVCIKENYYDSEEGTPDPNGGSGSGNSGDDEEDSNDDDASESDSPSSSGASKPSASSTGASPTESGSGDEASGTASEGAATETGDNDDAATGLVASSAALLGALVAVLAL